MTQTIKTPTLTPALIDMDDHGGGFAQDLATMERMQLGRRSMLQWIASASGVAMVAGCGGDSSSSSSTGSTTVPVTPTPSPTPTPTVTPTPTPTTGSCTVYATETNGPYPADGTNTSSGATSNVLVTSGVVRSDIRASFVSSSTVATGVQVTFTITVVDANNSCQPLVGYAVYLWQCDAAGNYSLYNLPSESYLRGVQVTDSNGQVTFTTIFPGCYSGRWPHIHFELFTSLTNATGGRYARLISQFAMPSAACTAVFATSGYSASVSNFSRITIASDNVFGDNTSAQITAMTPELTGSPSAGYTATATVAIAT